jgi:hypothetical protein
MTLIGRVARTGFRKGVLEGSRGWLYVAVAATGLRVVQRIARAAPRTVYSEELRSGEALEIRAVPRTR